MKLQTLGYYLPSRYVGRHLGNTERGGEGDAHRASARFSIVDQQLQVLHGDAAKLSDNNVVAHANQRTH